MDEILWCDHSNETSLAELLYGNIFFVTSQDEKIGFRCFYQFLFYALLNVVHLLSCNAGRKQDRLIEY